MEIEVTCRYIPIISTNASRYLHRISRHQKCESQSMEPSRWLCFPIRSIKCPTGCKRWGVWVLGTLWPEEGVPVTRKCCCVQDTQVIHPHCLGASVFNTFILFGREIISSVYFNFFPHFHYSLSFIYSFSGMKLVNEWMDGWMDARRMTLKCKSRKKLL